MNVFFFALLLPFWLFRYCKTFKNQKILNWNEIKCDSPLFGFSIWFSFRFSFLALLIKEANKKIFFYFILSNKVKIAELIDRLINR